MRCVAFVCVSDACELIVRYMLIVSVVERSYRRESISALSFTRKKANVCTGGVDESACVRGLGGRECMCQGITSFQPSRLKSFFRQKNVSSVFLHVFFGR